MLSDGQFSVRKWSARHCDNLLRCVHACSTLVTGVTTPPDHKCKALDEQRKAICRLELRLRSCDARSVSRMRRIELSAQVGRAKPSTVCPVLAMYKLWLDGYRRKHGL